MGDREDISPFLLKLSPAGREGGAVSRSKQRNLQVQSPSHTRLILAGREKGQEARSNKTGEASGTR